MTALRPDWHCPSCRIALDASGDRWQCHSCSVRSLSPAGIPLLVTDPLRYLGDTISGLRAFCATQQERLKHIRQLQVDPKWKWRMDSFERLAHAAEQHCDLANDQIDELIRSAENPIGPSLATGNVAKDSQYYGMQNLTYPRMDWGSSQDAQEQVAISERVLLDKIERYCDPAGEAVMLGAATGRYACSMAPRFAHLTAIELCYTYAHLFARLQQHSLTLLEPSRGICDSADTLVATHEVQMPRHHPPVELSYVIADARQLPLGSGSQSTALSIYFADVLPLGEWLTEVHRVLRPGGRLINFGPLHYHFDSPEWTLTPDEIRAYVQRTGFVIEEESWLEIPWGRAGGDGGYTVHRVWSYVLTRC